MREADHHSRVLRSRRAFLRDAGVGAGALAMAGAIPAELLASGSTGGRTSPYPARAKRVIHLCMAGGMSHLESFDYKPELVRMSGKPMPKSFTAGQPIAQLQGKKLVCLAPQFGFRKHGESGQEISDAFPHMARLADDLCIVRSVKTEQINHDPAHTFMNTGSSVSGRPSMGSWLLRALGSDSLDLPGYVVLTSVGRGGQSQPIAARQWHSGFLPSNLQGVHFQSTGAAVHYVEPPPGATLSDQRQVLRAIEALNRQLAERVDDPEIAARIHQYELAYRMQTSIPRLSDLSDEDDAALQMYGTRGADGSYAANCLMARRLVERGVRFIQLYHRGWDHHGGIKRGFTIAAKEVDQATTALVLDLKQRGLLEDTLLVFGPEFGRTPMAQGSGRDHHIKGFSMWLAGGGIRGGMTWGKTDELGYHAVEDVTHVHDIHATMLHLFGIDHEKLTHRHQGRDYRLTDIAGHVVHDIVV